MVKLETAPDRESRPPRFAFVLQPEFPINAFILATEALRIANQNSGRQIFDWIVLTEKGQAVRASNGMWITPESQIGDAQQADFVLVFEGNLPTQRNSARLLAVLRAALRFGSTVIGIDTGAFALAQAGLAESREVTLHWEAAPAFAERFPELPVKDCLYTIDGTAGFCAGGIAALDLMLELIGRLRGRALADEVANALVHTPREGERKQRPAEVSGESAPSFQRQLITLLEQNLDFPLSPRELAVSLGISLRTLERQCALHFGQTPARLYLKIRLQAARNLLFYEELSVKSISNACGFSYPSVFTRAFTQQFGQSPRRFRIALRANQERTLRPELQRLAKAG
jgi:AraC family transcriptional regulator, carnitine catabolism transcriptional activator